MNIVMRKDLGEILTKIWRVVIAITGSVERNLARCAPEWGGGFGGCRKLLAERVTVIFW